jgi:type III secretion system HrpE/YscL family protein
MGRVIRADNARPGVMPSEVVSAHQRARDIVADAERRADDVRARAEAAGRAQAAATLAQELLRVAEARDAELAALHSAALEIALQTARRVIGDEIAARPELLASRVGALLERVRRARSVSLRVHPDDHAALEAALPAIRERATVSGTLRVEPDAGVARGGCVVHSDVGSLDARVETQLAAIARALGKPG